MPERTEPAASVRGYAFAFVALLVLATLSLLLATSSLRTGLAVALAIAFIKAALVLGRFMHLLDERFSFKLVMLSAGLLVVTLLVLTTLDPVSRRFPPAPEANGQYRPVSP